MNDKSVPRIGKTVQTPTFGSLLRTFREKQHQSQVALSRKINHSPSFISLLESGHRHPSQDIITEIAKELRLNETQYKQLLEAAGYAADALKNNIETMRHIVGSPYNGTIPVTVLQIMTNEFHRITEGWQKLYQAIAEFEQGKFQDARNHLEALVSKKEETIIDNQGYPLILHNMIIMYLGHTLVHKGDLQDAEIYAKTARRNILDAQQSEDYAAVLYAEILALQGEIAIRNGGYALAQTLIQESQHIYEGLLKISSPQRDIVAEFGMGKSHKRSALVALFQGNPSLAHTYCFQAEAIMRGCPDSQERTMWLRAIGELRAWALTESGDGERAIALRKSLQNEYEHAKDRYRLGKNALFLGDDYRRAIEEALTTERVNAISNAAARQKEMHRVLQRPKLREYLREAERCYRAALTLLTEFDVQIILGRCLRGLAIILRFKTILAGSTTAEAKEYIKEARKLFMDALSLEQRIHQDRRVPSVYEPFAELEWDMGKITAARNYYTSALSTLESGRFKSDDAATQRLITRIREAIATLGQTTQTEAPPGMSIQVPTSQKWDDLVKHLEKTLYDYFFEHSNILPIALAERDNIWLQEVIKVENTKQPRRLAQNPLSFSLTMLVPAGYDANVAYLHSRRYQLLQNQVMFSTQGINWDICYRDEVRQDLEARDTNIRRLTLAQAKEAERLMHAYPNGYRLVGSPFPIPFTFEIRDASVLLELPMKQAGFLKSYITHEYAHEEDTLCYAFHDTELARKFTQIFDDMVKESQSHGQDQSTAWLNELAQIARGI